MSDQKSFRLKELTIHKKLKKYCLYEEFHHKKDEVKCL